MSRSFGSMSVTSRSPMRIPPQSNGLQSGHHPQRRGFAATGWTHQDEEFAFGDIEVEVVDSRAVGAGIHLGHLFVGHLGHDLVSFSFKVRLCQRTRSAAPVGTAVRNCGVGRPRSWAARVMFSVTVSVLAIGVSAIGRSTESAAGHACAQGAGRQGRVDCGVQLDRADLVVVAQGSMGSGQLGADVGESRASAFCVPPRVPGGSGSGCGAVLAL